MNVKFLWLPVRQPTEEYIKFLLNRPTCLSLSKEFMRRQGGVLALRVSTFPREARVFKRVYRRYADRKKTMDNVYKFIEENDGSVRPCVIQEIFGIPESSARRFLKRWKEDHEYRNYDYSARGKHSRIFSAEEERSIAEFIHLNILESGYYFTDDFRHWIMQAFLKKHRDNDDELPDFNASNGFIYDFKCGNNISSRRAHFKRRNPASTSQIAPWIQEITSLLQTVRKEDVYNCDETSWKLFPNGLLTWAQLGGDNVAITTASEEKKCLTALATIRADGTKMPLMLIAKGKTSLVESTQLGDTGVHLRGHSENGWMNQENFEAYLKWIRQQSGHDRTIHLILDVYPTHKTQSVKLMAQACNIVLHFIPESYTDQLQPLDRRCFGALKATARRVFRQHYCANIFRPIEKITKKKMVEVLVYSWEHLGTNVIEDSWAIYREQSE